MLLIDELLLQIAILAEICIKCLTFIEKLQRSSNAGGTALRAPCLRRMRLCPNPQRPTATGGSAPRPRPISHLIENSWLRHCVQGRIYNMRALGSGHFPIFTNLLAICFNFKSFLGEKAFLKKVFILRRGPPSAETLVLFKSAILYLAMLCLL